MRLTFVFAALFHLVRSIYCISPTSFVWESVSLFFFVQGTAQKLLVATGDPIDYFGELPFIMKDVEIIDLSQEPQVKKYTLACLYED